MKIIPKIIPLLLLLFFSAVRCSWLCDLIGLDCVTQTAVSLLPPLEGWQNMYVSYTPHTQVFAFSLVHCTTLCTMGGFTAAIYFPVQGKCYLLGKSSLTTLNLVSTVVFKKSKESVQLQNVALDKTVYASPTWSTFLPQQGVDCDRNTFYSSTILPLRWFLVDLEIAYDIFDIKLLHRADTSSFNRFYDIEVRAGNTLVTGPDLSSYDLLGTVDSPPSTYAEWFVVFPPENSPAYQFVSIQIMRSSGEMKLDLAELYVDAIV